MKRRIAACLVALSATTAIGPAVRAEEVDYSNGPVLCAYRFMAMAYEVGRACYLERDKNFVVAMQKSLDQYRDFVERNEPMSAEKAKALETRYRARVHKDGFGVVDTIEGLGCESIRGDSKNWYNTEIINQKASIQSVVGSTKKILAKDRKPVDTGC